MQKRVAQEKSNTIYVFDQYNCYNGLKIDVQDNTAQVEHGTTKPPFESEGGRVNLWSGYDWILIDIHPKHQHELSLMLNDIDRIVDDLYNSQVGARTQEYTYAYQQALEWKSKQFEGDAPGMIQSAATSKGIEPEIAANEIISIAVQWQKAMEMVRKLRLDVKQKIRLCQQQMNTKSYYEALGIKDDFRKTLFELNARLSA